MNRMPEPGGKKTETVDVASTESTGASKTRSASQSSGDCDADTDLKVASRGGA